MDSTELARIKEVVARCEKIDSDISRLKQAAEIVNKTRYLTIDFDAAQDALTFCEDGKKTYFPLPGTGPLGDLTHNIREAILSIMEGRLNERVKALCEIKV